jgi:hypothetical protein
MAVVGAARRRAPRLARVPDGGREGRCAASPPSSSGLGRRPFKAVARVRIPLGARPHPRSRGAAWSARRPVKAEVAGSNPVGTAQESRRSEAQATALGPHCLRPARTVLSTICPRLPVKPPSAMLVQPVRIGLLRTSDQAVGTLADTQQRCRLARQDRPWVAKGRGSDRRTSCSQHFRKLDRPLALRLV